MVGTNGHPFGRFQTARVGHDASSRSRHIETHRPGRTRPLSRLQTRTGNGGAPLCLNAGDRRGPVVGRSLTSPAASPRPPPFRGGARRGALWRAQQSGPPRHGAGRDASRFRGCVGWGAVIGGLAVWMSHVAMHLCSALGSSVSRWTCRWLVSRVEWSVNPPREAWFSDDIIPMTSETGCATPLAGPIDGSVCQTHCLSWGEQ